MDFYDFNGEAEDFCGYQYEEDYETRKPRGFSLGDFIEEGNLPALIKFPLNCKF
jgi:hypothetical protein